MNIIFKFFFNWFSTVFHFQYNITIFISIVCLVKNVLSQYVYYHIIFYIAAGMEDSQEDNECLFIFFLDSSMATRGITFVIV
jgi:hypothetical protein